jgi:hypothetical protein
VFGPTRRLPTRRRFSLDWRQPAPMSLAGHSCAPGLALVPNLPIDSLLDFRSEIAAWGWAASEVSQLKSKPKCFRTAT